MNNIYLVGRLTQNPELKTTHSGIYVTSFTLAVDRPGSRDQTDFIRCVAWNQTAEFVTKYFTRGQRIGLEGELNDYPYEDKNGNKGNVYELVANYVEFVESKQASSNTAATFGEFQEIADNDLPCR